MPMAIRMSIVSVPSPPMLSRCSLRFLPARPDMDDRCERCSKALASFWSLGTVLRR